MKRCRKLVLNVINKVSDQTVNKDQRPCLLVADPFLKFILIIDLKRYRIFTESVASTSFIKFVFFRADPTIEIVVIKSGEGAS